MNSNGLNEHWTASEARKKREIAIRKDERMKVLDETPAGRRTMKNLQLYLFIAGCTLFAVCMIVLYGHMEYWYHLSYEESMLIPAGCFVSSALFVASVVDMSGR